MTKGNDIQVELKEMNSTLAQLPKEIPFDVPNNYFNDITNNIVEMVLANDFIEQQSANPYTVPEQYFSAFPQKINQKIKEETTVTPTLFSLYPLLKPMQVAAAILIIIIGGFSFLHVPKNSISFQQQLKNIPDEVVREYVAQNDDENLYNNFSVNSTYSFNKLSEEEISQFLEEQGWQ